MTTAWLTASFIRGFLQPWLPPKQRKTVPVRQHTQNRATVQRVGVCVVVRVCVVVCGVVCVCVCVCVCLEVGGGGAQRFPLPCDWRLGRVPLRQAGRSEAQSPIDFHGRID